MTNLYKDLIDETLSRVGNIIEPKIRDYVIKSLNQQYKTYNPKEIK
jgi:hypothetical protein